MQGGLSQNIVGVFQVLQHLSCKTMLAQSDSTQYVYEERSVKYEFHEYHS